MFEQKHPIVIKITKYEGEDKEKIEEFYKELAGAEYIGEDGDMVCVAKSKEEAFKKFILKICEDCGVSDADYLDFENIGIGYLFLADKDDEKNDYDSDWYIDYSGERKSDYEVFVYCV